MRCTSSRCTSAARRPRRVAKPSASIATTASKSPLVRCPVRPRAPRRRKELVLAVLAAGQFRGHLLREHVERRVMRDDAVELAAADRSQQGGALDEVVARGGHQASLRRARHRVARPAHALEERGNAVRRPNLADQVDVADIDAELERRRRDECLERAGLQPMLGIEARLLREAAVVGGDLALAKPFAQMPGRPLGHPSRVHEDQRGLVRGDQLGQAVVILVPDLVRHDRAERRAGNLHGQVELAAMALVDDRTVAPARIGPQQEPGDFFDRALRGRQTDALQGPAAAFAAVRLRRARKAGPYDLR